MYATKRLLTVGLAGASVLVLSGCGGAPEASSKGAETPLEAAQIQQSAITDEDWGTLCAYAIHEAASEVATYWIDNEDTCAINVDSVVGSEYWSFPDSFEAAGTDFDWDSATVEMDDDGMEAEVILGLDDPEAAQTFSIDVESVEGIGWQLSRPFGR